MKNTKDQIKHQVLTLMRTRYIHDIKVKDLVNELQISRSTFYKYYDCVFSVLQEIEDEYFKTLLNINSNFWDYPLDLKYCDEPHPVFLKCVQYLHENRELSNILWGAYGDHVFKVTCRKMLKDSFFPKDRAEKLFPENTEMYVNFIISGHIEILNRWLRNDHGIPPEKFATSMYQVMFFEVLHRIPNSKNKQTSN